MNRQELIDLINKARAESGQPPLVDAPGVTIRETVRIAKYDHTPLPGETLEPIETVTIENGQVTTVPGKGEA